MVAELSHVRASYDLVADRYANAVSGELAHRPLERALLGALPELAGVRTRPGVVADLGAGPGHVAADLGAAGVATVAVDISPRMAAIARRDHGVAAAAGSLTALPFADASLAAAVAWYVVIHLNDHELAAAATELARVLRPGGIAIMSIHVGDEVRHLDQWFELPVDLDFRFRSVEAIRSVLTGAGLTPVATLEREPIPDVEAPTRRAYVVARR